MQTQIVQPLSSGGSYDGAERALQKRVGLPETGQSLDLREQLRANRFGVVMIPADAISLTGQEGVRLNDQWLLSFVRQAAIEEHVAGLQVPQLALLRAPKFNGRLRFKGRCACRRYVDDGEIRIHPNLHAHAPRAGARLDFQCGIGEAERLAKRRVIRERIRLEVNAHCADLDQSGIVVPGIGLGLIWQFIYNNSWGPLSGFLKLVGLSSLDRTWLGPQLIIPCLTVAIVWTYVGYYLVILLAGIDKIPPTFFEAAVLDGASEWKKFTSITLPMIWDVMVVALLLWTIGSLKIFDLIAATIFPAPSTSAYTITIYIWSQAIGVYTPVFRLGYATALGVVLLAMVLVSVAVVRFLTRSEAIEY